MILCANPSAQFKSYQSEIEEAVLAVMRGDRYVLGEEVSYLEQEFADYIGTAAAIGVANGTDAIELSLRALDIGVSDEVITVSHTAVATVAAVEAVGASPVLVDVESQFYTLNPSQLEEVTTSKTKAVIVVHLYGQAANMDEIKSFCAKRNLFLIEDASQAHGAKYNEKRLGSIGDIGCFSLDNNKLLAAGEGGVLVTDNRKLFERALLLSDFSSRIQHEVRSKELKKYNETGLGFKHRIHPVSATIANNELKKIRIYPQKSKAMNLAFDVTPAKYVTGLITEKGVCKASTDGLKKLFK